MKQDFLRNWIWFAFGSQLLREIRYVCGRLNKQGYLDTLSSSQADSMDSLNSTLTNHPYQLSLLKSTCKADVWSLCCQLTLVLPCVGIHRRTLLMSLFLLLEQCPAYLVHLTWIFVRWAISGHTTTVLWSAASRICSKQHTTSYQAFLANVSIESIWWNHTVVLTQLQLGRILFILSEIRFPYAWEPINSSPYLSYV